MAKLVIRGTSKMLSGPDWAMNMELCEIINADPAQAKDAVKAVKKRMRNKNPKVQLLSLTVLETMIRNCGEIVHHQVAAKDVLIEMVKMAKKTKDTQVMDKVLVLVDSWQEGFGGLRGRHPQYAMAYDELRRAGFIFPRRTESNIPPTLSTNSPRQSSPDHALVSSMEPLRSLKSPTLSMTEIQNIRSGMEVLTEMLREVDPLNKQALSDEVIVELVEQCRAAEGRVMHLVNSTADEELLQQGLSLNDDLKKLLERHDAIASGKAMAPPPLIGVDDEDEDSSQLSHRRTTMKKNPQTSSASTNNSQQVLPGSQKVAAPVTDGPLIDFLSGDSFQDASQGAAAPNNTQLALTSLATQDQGPPQLSSLGVGFQSTPSLYNPSPQSDQGFLQQSIVFSGTSSQKNPYGENPAGEVGQLPQNSYVVPWAQPNGPSLDPEQQTSWMLGIDQSTLHANVPPNVYQVNPQNDFNGQPFLQPAPSLGTQQAMFNGTEQPAGQSLNANQQAMIYGVGPPSHQPLQHPQHALTFPTQLSSLPPQPSSLQGYYASHTQPLQMHASSPLQIPETSNSAVLSYAPMPGQYPNGLRYSPPHANGQLPLAPWGTTPSFSSSVPPSPHIYGSAMPYAFSQPSEQQHQLLAQQSFASGQSNLAAQMQYMSLQNGGPHQTFQNGGTHHTFQNGAHYSDLQAIKAYGQQPENTFSPKQTPSITEPKQEERMFKDLVDLAKTGRGPYQK